MLAPTRQDALAGFIARYETVRSREQRRVPTRRHLEALPFRDLSGHHAYEWSIRARSFRALLRRVVRPLERTRRPLVALDLGSGVGWLAYRLARRGHEVVAVDLVTNDVDGLGVHRFFEREVTSVQAEFDRLPLRDTSVDLVVYNAALHYAADYAATLREGMRVLREGGRLVIMDSPLYRDPASGAAMVRERDRAIDREAPVPSAGFLPEGFLTHDRLTALGRDLGVTFDLVSPWYGLRWWARPWLARLRGQREPAEFKLIIARRNGDR
jgi:SAM-dependent methyltransferase